jgi:hypothetical protein
MTSINCSPDRAMSLSRRLCLRKAGDCLRTARTTTNPNVRCVYLHMAQLWREMAAEADQNADAPSNESGTVLQFPLAVKN